MVHCDAPISPPPMLTVNGELKMKSLKIVVASAALVLGMGSIAQSQGTVDMSKMTCEDLLKGSGDSIGRDLA